ncbi:MAG: hypothetical protein CMO06_00405 [Thalassospira sp.]|uniref:DUF4153 domain-containing protein n=1 Tax=Thalassospira sp. TaxID=1912094 RepID=UPI000C4D81C0|nr:DUF4153 domain-containing protein [Thalassospira sp.]MAZ31607.1 hypothetical protein [Thalassospira sp.]
MKKAHWLFPLSGAAYGFAFWYLIDYRWEDNYLLVSLMTFIAGLAYCSWFAIGVRRLRDDLAVTLVLPLLAALQVLAFQHLVGFEHTDETAIFGLLACQALWVGVAVGIWRIWGPLQTTVLPNYPDRAALVPEIWSIKLALAFGLVGVAVFWPVFYALCSLFMLVGIDQIWELISEAYVALPLSGAAFATGILIAREKSGLLIPVRQVIGGMFRILYPIQASGLFLFLVAAALGGWEVLLDQDFGVWWTVMAAAAGLSYLLFGAVQAGEGSTLFGRIGDRVFRFTLWMAPIFALIAMATIYIRVREYGLTPSRVYAIWAAVFVLMATIWLSVAAFGRRQSTPVSLRRAFGHIAICGVLTAFIMHLPFLDPVSISARNQQSRLSSMTDWDTADLAFIARNLGMPGEKALAELDVAKPDTVPPIAELRSYIDPDAGRVMVEIDNIPVYPLEYRVSGEAVIRLLEGQLEYDRRFCRKEGSGTGAPNQCALLMVDLDGDGMEEAAFFTTRDYVDVYRYGPDDAGWQVAVSFFHDQSEIDHEEMLRDLANGNFEIVSPRYSDLLIGGARWGQYR